jgi:hypothetical protein
MSNEKANIVIPADQIPGFRVFQAQERGVSRNILLRTWGGLGDQICAEPTLRYALKHLTDCSITLASEHPELFRHLKFERIFDLKEEHPVYKKYLLFDTIVSPENLLWQFFSHCLTHCVDFASMCAFRAQLPNADKSIHLEPEAISLDTYTKLGLPDAPWVLVHAGKHWPSKTFPKDWWDAVLFALRSFGITPILIGADTDDNRSTVDVDTVGCIDLRNKLSIMESVWLAQQAHVVITNDSAPLHMAASGDAWIGFIATCKHPDYITHWRRGKWGWRMENLGLGGMWDVTEMFPHEGKTVTVEHVEEELLRSWLPSPKTVASFAVDCIASGK